jgi:hypothetical protein
MGKMQHKLAAIAASSEAPTMVLSFISLLPTCGVFDQNHAGVGG